MRVPRDISGEILADALRTLGYRRTHQTGSHIRLTTAERGEHHVTVPCHRSVRVGTLNGILLQVGKHFGLSKTELLNRLFP